MKINVLFISVWNNGFEIETNAKYNKDTKEVTNIESFKGELIDSEGDELEILDGEFIEFDDFTRLEVKDDGDGYFALT